MGENSDDNDPFEEDIVFDQSGLLTSRSAYSRQQMNNGFIPTFMLFIQTVFLCFAFIGLGLSMTVSQGPLIHLEVAVGIPTEKAFHSFTAHCVGMLIGGLLGSSLFEVYNRQFLIFVSLMWMSVSISVLPFTIPVSYWWTLSNLAALGAGLSFLFTGSNVLCLDLWGKQGGASLQSLHFSFAVGAFIAPILIQPFISGSYPTEVIGDRVENFSYSTTSTISPLVQLSTERIKREAANISSKDFGLKETNVIDSNDPSLSLRISSPHNSSIEMLRNNSLLPTPSTTIITATSEIYQNSSSSSPKESKSSFHKEENISTTNKTVKVPKPKPKFTNANLLREPSKWDRPPQKESLKEPLKVERESTTLEPTPSPYNPNSSSSDSFVKTEAISHETVSVSQVNADTDSNNNTVQAGAIISPAGYISTNDTDLEGESSLPPNSTDTRSVGSTIETDVNHEGTKGLDGDKVRAFIMNSTHHSTSNGSFDSYDVLVPTESNVKLTSLAGLNKTVGVLIPKDAAMFEIDFNNQSAVRDFQRSSEEDLYNEEFSGISSSDYSVGSNGDEIKEQNPQNEPQLLDLKEYFQDDVGNTISVIKPFSNLDTTQHHVQSHQSKPGTFSNVSDMNSRFFEGLVDRFRNYGVTSIHFVYICVGIFLLLNAVVSVVIMCHNPREPRSKQEDLTGGSLQRARVRLFFGVFSIYMFMAEALQGAVHHLLASAHTENGLQTSRRGVEGAAIFWGLMCATRFLCILISGCLRVRPSKILVVATFLMVLGTIFLCVGTFDKQDFLWGGIILVAIGLAPVLPTSFLWMAEQMRVSHRMCAFMIVLSSFGNSLTHTTLTHVLANSHLYAYLLIGISVCSLCFLCVSFCLLLRAQNSKSLAVPVGYELANQEEEEPLDLARPTPKNFDTMSRRLSDMGEAGQALLID